jgi:hypothetical protein
MSDSILQQSFSFDSGAQHGSLRLLFVIYQLLKHMFITSLAIAGELSFLLFGLIANSLFPKVLFLGDLFLPNNILTIEDFFHPISRRSTPMHRVYEISGKQAVEPVDLTGSNWTARHHLSG